MRPKLPLMKSTHSVQRVLTGNNTERRQLLIDRETLPHCNHANDRGRGAIRDPEVCCFDKIARQRINFDRASCWAHTATKVFGTGAREIGQALSVLNCVLGKRL